MTEKECAKFIGAVMDTEISHLKAERVKLISLRQSQAGPDQYGGAAVFAVEAVIAAKEATRVNLPK